MQLNHKNIKKFKGQADFYHFNKNKGKWPINNNYIQEEKWKQIGIYDHTFKTTRAIIYFG